jgi:hypothetical protein
MGRMAWAVALLILTGGGTALAAAGAPDSQTAPAPYIGNKGSRKIHRSSCVWGQKVSPGKRIYFTSYDEAKAAGYVPCHTCRPDLPDAAATALLVPPSLKDTDICASTTKPFFHRGSCQWAKKITAEHLIIYKSREEALAAGKSPCQVCKP